MPCAIVRPKRQTLREAKIAAGMTLGFSCKEHRGADPALHASTCWNCKCDDAAERTTMVGDDGVPYFVCGPGVDATQCGVCGYAADLLCDYPTGGGKTCDLPLCHAHAQEVGNDLHLCPLHFPIWQKQALTDRINPWPPRRP